MHSPHSALIIFSPGLAALSEPLFGHNRELLHGGFGKIVFTTWRVGGSVGSTQSPHYSLNTFSPKLVTLLETNVWAAERATKWRLYSDSVYYLDFMNPDDILNSINIPNLPTLKFYTAG